MAFYSAMAFLLELPTGGLRIASGGCASICFRFMVSVRSGLIGLGARLCIVLAASKKDGIMNALYINIVQHTPTDHLFLNTSPPFFSSTIICELLSTFPSKIIFDNSFSRFF